MMYKRLNQASGTGTGVLVSCLPGGPVREGYRSWAFYCNQKFGGFSAERILCALDDARLSRELGLYDDARYALRALKYRRKRQGWAVHVPLP